MRDRDEQGLPSGPGGCPAGGGSGNADAAPLLPFAPDCVIGTFVQRQKRFSVELRLDGAPVWVHSNNSGSMLGLTRPGAPVLASPAANPARKLKYTQECVWLAESAVPGPPLSSSNPPGPVPGGPGFWVGVNTSVPNRMLEVLETSLLNAEEIRTACRCAAEAGVDFVKTSTGRAGAPALSHIRIMREALPAHVGIKFSGFGTLNAPELALWAFFLGADVLGSPCGDVVVDVLSSGYAEVGMLAGS